MKKKRCKVVMLPTNKAENCILKDRDGRMRWEKRYFTQEYLNSSPDSITGLLYPKSYHLYITSDDKIEEGDIWINLDTNTLHNGNLFELADRAPSCKKVIATTDSELKDVPQIPQKFIEEYCRKGGIDEVDVEYWDGSSANEYDTSLKINHKDNTINIHLIKNTYTREEVEAIAAKFLLLGFGKSAEGRNAEILCESRWLEEMFPEHFESIEIFTKDNL